MYVVGMSQGTFWDMFHDNRLMQSKVISIIGNVIISGYWLVYYSWPIGGAVTKMMWRGQCDVTMSHIKFCVNISNLCRDTASDAVWHLSSKFVGTLIENGYVYRHKFHNFLPAWSEDDRSGLTRLGWEWRMQKRRGQSKTKQRSVQNEDL